MRRYTCDDAGYIAWLEENPSGSVLNTRAETEPSYLVLHRASCWTIRPGRNYAPGAFTARSYSKFVAANESEFAPLLSEFGAVGFSKRCSICHP